jgi:hypothetical protein
VGGEVPSGRVGTPEEPEGYVPLVVGEWGRRYGTVYVERGIWDRLRTNAQQFSFYLEDGSRCRLDLDSPKCRLNA